MKHNCIPPFLLCMGVAILSVADGLAAPVAPPPVAVALPPSLLGQNTYDLSVFGPIATPAQASQTLEKAIAAIQGAGGGVIVIPVTAPSAWVPQNNGQEEWRKPEAPTPAKSWGAGPGVTLFDARSSHFTLPQVSGLEVDRDFILPAGQSSPHWTYHPMLNLHNDVTKGTSDYAESLTQATPAGKDQKFFPESVRGVFPGQVLEVRGSSNGSMTVKSLGYDTASKRAYFVADAPLSCAAGTVLAARTTLSVIEANTRANNELQTFDVYNIRHHYSQGDTYMFSGRSFYMGDNYAPRDEMTPDNERVSGYGSVIYNARTQSETNIFRGVVASRDATSNEVRYGEAHNAQTLATGRPLINLNPKKWITVGSAQINVPAGAILNWGGSIWSTDAPWTDAVVGRYFTIDQPDEYVPTGDNVRRWYLITGLNTDNNGIKRLSVRRYWWGAKNEGVGISGLYNYKNYTQSEKKPVPLKYIIAPGSYVYDVADGAATSEAQSAGAGQRSLKIVPYADSGTPSDFSPGDPVEQAIGPEPFAPIALRAWMFDEVPGAFPAPVFDVANRGTPRDSVLSVAGPGGFGNVISVSADCKEGIQVKGDVDNAFLMFHRRDTSPDPLVAFAWDTYPNPTNKAVKRTTGLLVLPSTGALSYGASWNLTGQSAVAVHHLGASNAGTNFRGLAVAVPAGVTSCDVAFPTPEADEKYTTTIQPTWLTDHAVTTRTAKGFHVIFSQPAPTGASFDWLLIH